MNADDTDKRVLTDSLWEDTFGLYVSNSTLKMHPIRVGDVTGYLRGSPRTASPISGSRCWLAPTVDCVRVRLPTRD